MRAAVKNLSLIFTFIMIASHMVAQSNDSSSGLAFNSKIVTQKKFDFSNSDVIIHIDTTLLYRSFDVPLIYDFQKLALFCKFEEKVAQNSKMQMRFRLGSLDYVNYLEQKPHFQTPKN